MRAERQARKPAGCWYGDSNISRSRGIDCTGQRCFGTAYPKNPLISDSDGEQCERALQEAAFAGLFCYGKSLADGFCQQAIRIL